MKTRHTYLLTFILGLAWAVALFAHSSGPNPGVNGVFGPGTACNTCHSDNALNTGGSVTITGLPSTWTPGQTYPLTVTVSRAAARYGFQFSAVNNGTTAQAGTLLAASPNDARVTIAAGAIQYAQHNSFANTSGSFNFRWTAPSSASFGAIRFNVAGNASNNNFASSGDFIYTDSATVSAAATDTTPPVISAVTSTAITVSGATINWTTDEGSDTQVEYGTTTAYGSSTTLNTASVTSHSVNLTGLVSNTTYHYRVKSRDASGNLATGTDNTLVTAYTISNLGGVSRATDGSGDLTIGYARIRAAAGNTTPSGVAIFGYRQGGILVTETGVPDSPLITSGRIYAEVSADGRVNTGLAIANPNAAAATISFSFTNSSGTQTGSGLTAIPGNGQTAKFLNQDPFLSGAPFQGTFSFTSTQPVSVIALRGFLNERAASDFLLTTLPVVDLGAGTPTGTQVIPDFAVGDGWTTQILLINPTDSAQTGTVQFLNGAGTAISVSIGGSVGTSGPYSVPARSSQKLVITSAGGGGTIVGTVRVVPAGGGPVPVPMVIFSYKPAAFTQSEAGVPVTAGTAFRSYVESSSTPFINSGVAISNTTAVAGTATLSVTRLDGTAVGTSIQKALPASGQIVGFLTDADFFPALASAPFQGILRIATDVASSVVTLRTRINERGDFMITTTPPTVESGAPSSAERLFPDLANGGGYTTQFVLYSGTSGQSATGTLDLLTPDGAILRLNVN